MIDHDEMQTARAAYEQLRQITAISLAANMVLLALLVALLTIR